MKCKYILWHVWVGIWVLENKVKDSHLLFTYYVLVICFLHSSFYIFVERLKEQRFQNLLISILKFCASILILKINISIFYTIYISILYSNILHLWSQGHYLLYLSCPRLMSEELRSTYNTDDVLAVIKGQITSQTTIQIS